MQQVKVLGYEKLVNSIFYYLLQEWSYKCSKSKGRLKIPLKYKYLKLNLFFSKQHFLSYGSLVLGIRAVKLNFT